MIAYYFEQFSVIRVFGVLGISNSVIGLLIGIIVICVYIRGKGIYPGRVEIIIEIIYREIAGIVRENIGSKGGYYMPMILSIVLLIGVINVLGLLPYVYAPTTQIVITMGLSVTIVLGVTIRGFLGHGGNYLSIVMPSGSPLIIGPFMVLVETISYLSRGISLGVRLAANITAGHLLYSILTGFAYNMGIWGVLPISVLMGVILLEVGVALIQAYVYGLLTAIYIGEAEGGSLCSLCKSSCFLSNVYGESARRRI